MRIPLDLRAKNHLEISQKMQKELDFHKKTGRRLCFETIDIPSLHFLAGIHAEIAADMRKEADERSEMEKQEKIREYSQNF